MARYKYVVMTSPKPGMDTEYNQFYTRQHVPDVLRVPGILRAQRYKLTADQRAPENQPHKYLCVYDVETDDLARMVEEIGCRLGTPDMPRNEFMAQERLVAFFEEMEPEQVAPPESSKAFRAS
jgi:hypothetical protein